MMTHRESVLVLALAIMLSGVTGLLYAGYGRPVAQPVRASDPARWGYSVGPGWQATATPEERASKDAGAPGIAPGAGAAGVVATPTSVWLQPERDVPCDMADAIARDAATHNCEALWAAERDNPHVQRALQIEPGVQVSRIHDYGRFNYVLFSQALVVWRNTGDDGRIAVLSPHGCWRGLPETLQPPTR